MIRELEISNIQQISTLHKLESKNKQNQMLGCQTGLMRQLGRLVGATWEVGTPSNKLNLKAGLTGSPISQEAITGAH